MIPRIVIGNADRRRRPRLRLAYPLRIHLPGERVWVETKTEDLSCEGFSWLSERSFSLDQILDCELVIADEEPDRRVRNSLVLRCRALVVRVGRNGHEGAYRLACHFEDYTIHRQPIERNRALEPFSLSAAR
jgi:hypothetical protein